MFNPVNAVRVLYADQFVGRLALTSDFRAVFEYDPDLVHIMYEAYDATTNELATEITYKMWHKWLPPRTVKTRRARGAFGRF
jgi:hypothetical protein